MPHVIDQVVIFQKAIIVRDGNQVLALQRQTDNGEEIWDLPGGGLEKGEDIDRALKREVAEETQLIIEALQPVLVQTIHTFVQPGVDTHFICWRVSAWQGEVQLSDEHIAYRWVTPAEFATLPTWDTEGFFLKGLTLALDSAETSLSHD